MKRFRFRLERVLQYKLTIKGEKRRVLLQKNLKLHEARQVLETLVEAERCNGFGVRQLLTAREVYLIGLFGDRLKDQIVQQRLAIVQLEQEVAEAMLEYTEAAREARALEILKERKLQEYTDYVFKEEGKFLDELAVQKGNKLFHEEGELL